MTERFVWIFSGSKGRFPGGVFTSVDIAETWIRLHGLTGVLTQYPIDVGSYDWALGQGFVSKKIAERADQDFIGSFSSASFEHFHYELGNRE